MKPPLPPMPPLPLPVPLPPLLPGSHAGSSGLPVGAVIAFAGVLSLESPAPEGYLLCDGESYDKDEYWELFSVIGYIYSAEAEGQTFQVPDLEGQFLRGVDPKGKVDRDRDKRLSVAKKKYEGVGSLQPTALQRHEHEYTVANQPAMAAQQGILAGTLSEKPTKGMVPSPDGATLNVSDFESRPPNVALYFFIRARTTGELRDGALPPFR